MSCSIDKGKAAELMVAAFLRKNGCIIAKMNYHSRYGEIDIIAETQKTVMFIEVKRRKEGALVSPAESVDTNKQRKIILTAEDFLSKSRLQHLQPRFDVAEVYEEEMPDGQTKIRVHYIKNAFGIN
ncbi:MAG: YraN family protein [Ruminococcaceae bacterium]|nr:YraN family protein [Oscillospiraceae bacterium]